MEETLLFDYDNIEKPVGREPFVIPMEWKIEFQERVKTNWASSMDKLIGAGVTVIARLDNKSSFKLRGTLVVAV